MRHEMLTQRARFCIGAMAKKGTLSQHFVTHVVPPLVHFTNSYSSETVSYLRIDNNRTIINFIHHMYQN